MIHAQDAKFVTLFLPQSVATNGNPTGTVAVAGFNYATILLQLGTAAATNVDATMVISESDGTTYTTSTDFTMTTAAPNTSTGQLYAWHIKPRKANLKVSYTPNTSVARLAACTCILTRGSQPPDTATLRGLAGQVVSP